MIFGIVFSTAYPLINLTEIFNNHNALPAFVPGLNQNVSQLIQVESISALWQIITMVFYLGVLFMASRLIIQFISLYRVHKNSSAGMLNDLKIRILSDKISPFSFWQNIYVNPNLHKPQDLNNIIEHEKIHVDELHTLDIILAEISLVFYWFNPGVWLMKKAVKENIEFITDNKILKKGVNKKAYQYSLLDVGTLQNPVSIINNFNLSDLKKRIVMMNVKPSSSVNLTRYVFVLPIILCVSLAFTIDKKDIEKQIVLVNNHLSQSQEPQKTIAIEKVASVKGKNKSKIVKKKNIISDSIQKFSFVFKTNFKTANSSNQSITDELNKLVGKVIHVVPMKNAEAKTVFYHTAFKDTVKTNPSAISMFFQDSNTNQSDKPLKGTINKVVLIKAVTKSSHRNNGISFSSTGSIGEIDYFIDGKKATKDDFKNLDMNNVQDIKMQKSSSGEIHITTKP
ncbi:M56 family metallopeptidase [Pedobacter aquatilis]|uniref:M56 family metallopeptidase n=1 Tax=Pedobacter aquatilis TaxID=351343 RepID=UPI0025B4C8E5|nr:M56 family metallopeptidase [Pedobacter aquatilis]MDN3588698.1 M56 family metallopeptidase [Pedobacter aquatilis]